jgi:hypothetical protein
VPDSGTARRSFRGFRGLQEGRCFFRHPEHIDNLLQLIAVTNAASPDLAANARKAPDDGLSRNRSEDGSRYLIDEVISE